MLHPTMHDASWAAWEYSGMLILCSECGHRLLTEVGSIGVFGTVNYFDDKAGSDTYAERVSRCPGCGLWLYYGADIEPGEVAQRR